jgi:hypothetical protein
MFDSREDALEWARARAERFGVRLGHVDGGLLKQQDLSRDALSFVEFIAEPETNRRMKSWAMPEPWQPIALQGDSATRPMSHVPEPTITPTIFVDRTVVPMSHVPEPTITPTIFVDRTVVPMSHVPEPTITPTIFVDRTVVPMSHVPEPTITPTIFVDRTVPPS